MSESTADPNNVSGSIADPNSVPGSTVTPPDSLSVVAALLLTIVAIPVALIPILGAILPAGLAIALWFTYRANRHPVWLILAIAGTAILLLSVGLTLLTLPVSVSTQVTEFKTTG